MSKLVNTRAVPATKCAPAQTGRLYFTPGKLAGHVSQLNIAKSVCSVECSSHVPHSLVAKSHVCGWTTVRALAEIIQRIRITDRHGLYYVVVTNVSGKVRCFGINFGVTVAALDRLRLGHVIVQIIVEMSQTVLWITNSLQTSLFMST